MWTKPSVQLQLNKNEVHLWKASLEFNDERYRKFYNILSKDEQIRANHFRFEKDRVQFVLARGILRQLLAGYLSMEASELRFQYTPLGKPYILRDYGLDFNVSHSSSLALFGFTIGRMIGIDIEFMSVNIEFASMVKQFFSPYEIKTLFSLPVSQQAEAFYMCWTRKEALIKAIGIGLSLPLDQFDVTLIPDEPAEILDIRWNHMDKNKWSMLSLSPASRFIGALVIEGETDCVHRFIWVDLDK